MAAIHLRACAKINLCLEIPGRREDGYHDLATVFQSVSLADELAIETLDGPGIELRVPSGGAPAGPENLVWRAAQHYQDLRGWPAGVSIELTKRIPSGAGLGGGSSDAAAVLAGLARRDDDPPAADVLWQVAAELGADVPFFLTGGTAIAQGRGDLIRPLPDLPDCWIVLVQPDLRISTAEAFGMLAATDFSDGSDAEAMADAIARGDLSATIRLVRNDFSRALEERWPQLAALKRALREQGALTAEITGSGSVVFGIFDDSEAARGAARASGAEGDWAEVVSPVRSGWEIADEWE